MNIFAGVETILADLQVLYAGWGDFTHVHFEFAITVEPFAMKRMDWQGEDSKMSITFTFTPCEGWREVRLSGLYNCSIELDRLLADNRKR